MMEKRLGGGLRLAVVGCVLLLTAGCGSDAKSDSDAAAGSGGTASVGGSAGSAGSAVGGSGGGASLPRKGAVSLDFQAPAGCVDPAMTIYLPDGATAPVDASGAHAFLATGDMVGGAAARVACVTSHSKDGTWMVEGQITVGADTHFSIYSHGAVPGQRNAAGVGIVSPKLSREHSTQSGSESGATLTLVEPGRMAGTFDVPHLFNFKDDTECVLGTSYFQFENCVLSYADF